MSSPVKILSAPPISSSSPITSAQPFSSPPAHDSLLLDSSGPSLSDADYSVPNITRSLSCPPSSTAQSLLMIASSGQLKLQKAGQVCSGSFVLMYQE